MVRTQIQITEEQAKALKKIAAIRHVSMAELIRQGVDRVIGSNTTIDEEEKIKRAIRVAGKFRSGQKGISENHDDYLAEAIQS